MIDHPSFRTDIGCTEDDVRRAIRTSVQETRTVELPYSDGAAEILAHECDGESDSEHTYWGTDENDAEWQVRLVEP